MIERILPEQRHPIKDESLIAAIAIKANACYYTLAFLQGFSGSELTDEWWLCRNHSLKDLVSEADARVIDLTDTVTSVERTPLPLSMKYRHARGEVSDTELERWWQKVKRGEIEP